MEDFLSLAHHLADEAGTIIRQYFRQSFDIERKNDETPVTIADRDVEARLRRIVEEKRPEDGILGEEYGPKDSRSGLTWVFDPIDGTKSFIAGRPTFGTLIALCRNEVPVLGIIDQPIAKERWAGAEQMPTTFNGKIAKTRPCPKLAQAVSTCTSPRQIETMWPRLYTHTKAVVWGGDCYSYGLLSCGWIDMALEDGLHLYDFAALPPIVQGAGGIMCDWEGRPLTLSSKGDTLALGDAALKDEALAFLRG